VIPVYYLVRGSHALTIINEIAVVVFSHGYLGMNFSYERILRGDTLSITIKGEVLRFHHRLSQVSLCLKNLKSKLL